MVGYWLDDKLGPRLSFLSLPPMLAKPLGALKTSLRCLGVSPIAPRLCPTRRALSTSLRAFAAQPQPIKTVFDIHTVEDLQQMSAEEALHEHGRRNSSLRHFTGLFLSQSLLFPEYPVMLTLLSLLLAVNFGWARTRCSPLQKFLMTL